MPAPARVSSAVAPQIGDPSDELGPLYVTSLRLIERLHRQLLDVIKDELDRHGRGDINSVQALLVFNIGDEELTAGELKTRGHYLGSNVSYNLKKLVENNYLVSERSETDRRSVRISLSAKGEAMRDLVSGLFERHLKSLQPVAELGPEGLQEVNGALMRLERFWEDHVKYRL